MQFKVKQLDTKPAVSILLPIYNGAQELHRTIKGIQAQDFHDYELIMLDDGSTDETWDLILELAAKDERIIPIRNNKNCGIVAALNTMADAAHAEILIREDCGDYSKPGRYLRQYQALIAYPIAVASVTAYWILDMHGDPVGIQEVPSSPDLVKQQLQKSNNFGHATFAIRRSAFIKTGGYDPKAKHVEDYDLLIKLSQIGDIVPIADALVARHLNPLGISFRNFNTQKAYAEQVRARYFNGQSPQQLEYSPLSEAEAWDKYHEFIGQLYLVKGEAAKARQHLCAITSTSRSRRVRRLVLLSCIPGPIIKLLRQIMGKNS